MHQSTNLPGTGLFIVDRLLKRSGWIFILLALLAGCAYYLLASQTNDERASAAEINLAGRRRMLSQRIGLLASQLQQNPRPEDIADLEHSTREMADIHRTLLDGTPDRRIRPLPESLRTAFDAPDGPHAKIAHFLELANALRALPADSEAFRTTLQQIVSLDRGEVLTATDRQVGDYQRLSEAKSDALHWQLWLLFIASLALLAYSALRVLRPLIMQVRGALAELESSGAALRQAMAENRLILDTTDDGMFGIDQAGRIRFINPAAAQMLGVDAGKLTGQAHHPAILADNDQCPICTCLAQGERQKVEAGRFTRLQGAARQAFAVEYSVVPRADGQGAFVSFRDISARQATEGRLESLRLRLVDAIEAMDDAFALFDADDRISLYNLRFTEFFTFSGEHGPLGMRFTEFIRGVAQQGLYAQAAEHLETWLSERLTAHQQACGSTEIACADGRWLRATERRTREGGTVVIWSDVTHLKRALIAADHASRAKSEFLSRMSHELRTPLNAILGFTQVLRRSSDSTLGVQQREYIDHIEQGGRHLLSLINEVLDLSAIEAGKQAIEIDDVRLSRLLNECLTLVSPLAAGRGIRMHHAIPPELTVRADRKRLKQVVINLLSNAIKYNRPDGEVRISWEQLEGRLRLGVHDTGAGIAPEQVDRVFRPFERLAGENIEGTGIGLAITRRLVELMKGSIGVSSQPGEGSCFWIELPSADATPSAQPVPAADSENAANRPETSPVAPLPLGKTLIAVGLDAQTAGMLELICRTIGDTSLLTAADPASALASLGQVDCRAILAAPSTLAAMREGAAAKQPRPAFVALAETGASPGDTTADYWHPLPINPRQLARILRELTHGN